MLCYCRKFTKHHRASHMMLYTRLDHCFLIQYAIDVFGSNGYAIDVFGSNGYDMCMCLSPLPHCQTYAPLLSSQHVIKMVSMCYHRVANMLSTCYQHVINVLSTCYQRVITFLSICYRYVCITSPPLPHVCTIAVLSICYQYVINMLSMRLGVTVMVCVLPLPHCHTCAPSLSSP
jgi:hypothetical protein